MECSKSYDIFLIIVLTFLQQTSIGNVFGRPLLGNPVKNNYVFGVPQATMALRIPFPQPDNTTDVGAGAGEASQDSDQVSYCYFTNHP